jgi:hypothetical protein
VGTTANRSYPYPDPGDPADFAGGLEALARAVDSDVQALANLITAPPLSVFDGGDFASLSSGVETAAAYSQVTYSNGAGTIGPGGNRILVVEPGTYFLQFLVRAPDVTSVLEAFIRVNTTDFGRVIHEGNAPAQPRLMVSALVPNMVAGDIITTTVIQNTGAFVATFAGPRLTMYRIAP